MSRPLKEIDKTSFEKLCELQCTEAEICGFFDITDKTLSRWCKDTYGKGFSEVFRAKRERGKISLRRTQFRLAENNASMAIWLGKQYLGQSDESESLRNAREALIIAQTEKIRNNDTDIEDLSDIESRIYEDKDNSV